jgi:hypothetical protein
MPAHKTRSSSVCRPSLRDLAQCLVKQSDAVECGKQFAVTQGEKAALGVIESLQGTSKNRSGPAAANLTR